MEILLEEMSEMKIQNINQGKIQGPATDKEISTEEKVSSTSSKPIKKKDEKALSRMAEPAKTAVLGPLVIATVLTPANLSPRQSSGKTPTTKKSPSQAP